MQKMPLLMLGLGGLIGTACAPDAEPDVTLTRPAALTDASRHAQLDFQPGWVQVQRGALVPSGSVEVRYARSRLGKCASPTIFSYARFQPGGEQFSSDEALSFDVPTGATSVELWFRALAPGCEEWDSNYGANWRFPVTRAAPPAVGWVGDFGASTNRSCAPTAGIPEPIRIDSYMRERACIFIDSDVWIPGVTDTPTAHPEYIEAQVDWKKDSRAPTTAWLTYQGIVGNNARFRFTLPDDLRNQSDWSTATYSFRFSTDGISWTHAAQPTGADWTLVRAF